MRGSKRAMHGTLVPTAGGTLARDNDSNRAGAAAPGKVAARTFNTVWLRQKSASARGQHARLL